MSDLSVQNITSYVPLQSWQITKISWLWLASSEKYTKHFNPLCLWQETLYEDTGCQEYITTITTLLSFVPPVQHFQTVPNSCIWNWNILGPTQVIDIKLNWMVGVVPLYKLTVRISFRKCLHLPLSQLHKHHISSSKGVMESPPPNQRHRLKTPGV